MSIKPIYIPLRITNSFLYERPHKKPHTENTNNTMFLLTNDIVSGILTLDIAATSNIANFTLDTYKIDKNIFNAKKEIALLSESQKILSTPIAWVLVQDGSISNIGIPYVFDFRLYDYAINITNSGTGILQYRTSISSANNLVYTVPIDDSIGWGDVIYLIHQYKKLDSSIIFRQKEILLNL